MVVPPVNPAASSRARLRVLVLVAVLLGLTAGLVRPPTGLAVPAPVQPTLEKQVWQVDGRVRAVLETPDAIYLGGRFNNLLGPNGEWVPRSNLAALDPVTGAPLPFVADTNRQVWGLRATDDLTRLYVVGEFTKINGVSRKRAAAVDPSGAVLGFNPDLDGRVRAVAVHGDTVYLGGDFTTVDAVTHPHLAAVTAKRGTLVPAFVAWPNDYVSAIEVAEDGSRLFVGGNFTWFNGVGTVWYLGSLDPVTGAPQSWGSGVQAEVIDIDVSPTEVAVATGGRFNQTVVWDRATTRTLWSVVGDGNPQAVAFDGDVLYVGGHFTQWRYGVPTGHLVAVQARTGDLLPWNVRPNSNLGVFALSVLGAHLSVGGDFTKLNRVARAHYARFDTGAA